MAAQGMGGRPGSARTPAPAPCSSQVCHCVLKVNFRASSCEGILWVWGGQRCSHFEAASEAGNTHPRTPACPFGLCHGEDNPVGPGVTGGSELGQPGLGSCCLRRT